MAFLGFVGLLALAYLLLPVLSFVRMLQLGRELIEVRRRLDLMERQLHDSGPSPQRPTAAEPATSSPAGTPPRVVPSTTSTSPEPVITQERVFAPPRLPDWARETNEANLPNVPNDPNDPNDLEVRIGGRWLQHAGLIVLLLGIAFFLRYAFEHEWLSPTIRVALGVVAGLGMAWGGVRLASKYRAYGLLLAGGGVAALYLSFYAALNLYALVGPEVAFTGLVVITVAAAVLADRTDSQAIALMAVGGGFATPFLVGGRGDQQVTLFSYIALLIGATMYLAHRRRWRWLNVASLALTIVTVAAWGDSYYTDAKYLRTQLFLTLYCVMFNDVLRRSWSRVGPSAVRASAGRDDAPLVASLLLAPVAYHICSVVILAPHGLAFLIYLIAFTAILAMLGDYFESPLLRAAGFIGMALPLGTWIQTNHWRDWVLTSTIAIVGIYAMHVAAQLRSVAREKEFDEREIALVHANGIGVYVALYEVLSDTLSIEQLAGIGVLLALLNAGIWFIVRRAAPVGALHWLGVGFTLLAAAVWLEFGGPWAVAIWATEAAVVFWIALNADRQWLRAGAWVLFAIAALRWAQSDIQTTTLSYAVLLNARALTGMYLIALLYLAAWMTTRDARASRARAQDRAILIVAASVLTVIVISTEIVSFWQLRAASADAYVAREMMLSASWVLYAALLVVLGMRRKYAPIRYFAIVLFGIALIKVFVVDLETLGGVYRIAGFVVVGLILLVVSFLYQRNALEGKKPV